MLIPAKVGQRVKMKSFMLVSVKLLFFLKDPKPLVSFLTHPSLFGILLQLHDHKPSSGTSVNR